MHSRRVGDLPHDRILINVNHHHLAGVADIKPPRELVHRQVIPAAFAADRDFLDELVRDVRTAGRKGQAAQDAKGHRTEDSSICFHK